MLIDTLTGEQNWNGSSCRFNVFWCPTNMKNHVGLKECHLGIAAKQARGNTSRVKTSKQPALVGLDEDMGVMWETRYEVPEGSVLKLGSFKSEGTIQKSAQQYIRVREEAALRMVKFDIPNDHGRARFPYAYVRGHFDLLTVEEAAVYGVKTPPAFVKMYSPTRCKMVYETLVIEPEASPKVVMSKTKVATGKKGEKDEVMMFEKVRKIRER